MTTPELIVQCIKHSICASFWIATFPFRLIAFLLMTPFIALLCLKNWACGDGYWICGYEVWKEDLLIEFLFKGRMLP